MDTLSWVNIKSAFVTFIYFAILAMGGYVVGIGDIFKIDLHALVNVGVMAGLAGMVSLLKALTTSSTGKALGMQIK